jgi:hypothetical protein
MKSDAEELYEKLSSYFVPCSDCSITALYMHIALATLPFQCAVYVLTGTYANQERKIRPCITEVLCAKNGTLVLQKVLYFLHVLAIAV